MTRISLHMAGASALLFASALAALPAQTSPLPDGKAIYESKCVRCHGQDGTKGMLGAKNLQLSRLPDAELLSVVTKGRRIMPAWEKRLSPQERQLVVDYVKQLRD